MEMTKYIKILWFYRVVLIKLLILNRKIFKYIKLWGSKVIVYKICIKLSKRWLFKILILNFYIFIINIFLKLKVS